MSTRYTKEELEEYFFEALAMFNDVLESDIISENVVLDFFTPANGLAVYKRFCEKYFSDKYEKQHETENYFEFIAAEAFVGKKLYGVLIRSDIEFSLSEVLMTFLHEISHLFCTRNEIESGDFFDRYCMGSGEEDGYYNAGYAVWREAIANIMADSIMSEYATLKLEMAADEILNCYNHISRQDSEAKKYISLIIVYVMTSEEVAGTEDWNVAEKARESKINISNSILREILKLVFEKLHQSPFWEITPEFIRELGILCIKLIVYRTFENNRSE